MGGAHQRPPPRVNYCGSPGGKKKNKKNPGQLKKTPAASGGAFRAGGHSADMARSASTCPSKEAVCSVGGICPPNPLTRMPFLPTASSGATWHDFAYRSIQFLKTFPYLVFLT